MQWFLLTAIIVVFCFGFVVLFGAPYLPTLTGPAQLAIGMIDLKHGETLLELGCGDGKVLKMAAATGLNVVGFELNPILVLVARMRTWRYRKQVRVVWGNLWNEKKWPEADGIFVFMLPRYMKKLDNKISHWHTKPVKLVSFAFPIHGKQTTRQDKSGVYLYDYC